MVRNNLSINNLITRFISGVIIAAAIIGCIIFPESFAILMLGIGSIMIYEWYRISGNAQEYILMSIVIPIAVICLIVFRYESSRVYTILYFSMIWSTDTFAMLGGKTFGGPKLAPSISPRKTWSGLICGIIASSIISKLFFLNYDISFKIDGFILGILIAIVGQCSDLYVSILKRKFSVKDSGNIIPGHGGVLDRFDSIIFTAPIMLLLLKF